MPNFRAAGATVQSARASPDPAIATSTWRGKRDRRRGRRRWREVQKWYTKGCDRTGRSSLPQSQGRPISMHRSRSRQGMVVDHINGNGLDNRRLQPADLRSFQNSQNSRRRKPGKSQFRGVFPRGGVQAAISDGKPMYLGLFDGRGGQAVTARRTSWPASSRCCFPGGRPQTVACRLESCRQVVGRVRGRLADSVLYCVGHLHYAACRHSGALELPGLDVSGSGRLGGGDEVSGGSLGRWSRSLDLLWAMAAWRARRTFGLADPAAGACAGSLWECLPYCGFLGPTGPNAYRQMVQTSAAPARIPTMPGSRARTRWAKWRKKNAKLHCSGGPGFATR